MESQFRKRVQDTFEVIEQAFESVDPDIAECEQSLGSLTIQLSNGSKCILSVQPSVQQLWVALASRGTAYHFNFNEASQKWMDDKGKGVELMSLLEDYLSEAAGCRLNLASTDHSK